MRTLSVDKVNDLKFLALCLLAEASEGASLIACFCRYCGYKSSPIAHHLGSFLYEV